MKKVLLTGAAGRIGTAFLEYEGDRYDVRLTDVHIHTIDNSLGREVVQADLSDLDNCQELCRGVDTVLHLAADPSPKADFYESLLDNNIKATYNIFRAAKDQGCRRVITASSVHAVLGYPLDTQPHPDMPVKPTNMYGVTKIFGEAVAHCFSASEGLSCIAVRIGGYGGNRNHTPESVDARTLSVYVSPRDLSHLFACCIDAPDSLRFAIFQGVSDNRFKRMSIDNARELVGYTPRDDAFELFEVGLQNRERWWEEWGRGEQREQKED